jgi:hypothetical protein
MSAVMQRGGGPNFPPQKTKLGCTEARLSEPDKCNVFFLYHQQRYLTGKRFFLVLEIVIPGRITLPTVFTGKCHICCTEGKV